MKLYYIPGACSLASHIVALEGGLPLELAVVTFSEKGKVADGQSYLEINPKGAVPALDFGGDAPLTENAVVMQYLASLKPASGMLPGDALQRLRCLEFVNFIATDLHKNFAPLFNPALSSLPKEPFIEILKARIGQVTDMLGDKTYLMGNSFTIADAYLFTILRLTQVVPGVEWNFMPNLEAYIQRVGSRPAVVQAMQEEGLI